MKWTKSQELAIVSRGRDILVSAAAGSGKTAVLTERVVRLVTDVENPVDIDTLVIVTFTKAAAHEMRARIQKRLAELAGTADDVVRDRVERQQLLLDSTHISTIHSFCTELLRTNFSQLDLNADFIVADDREMELLLGICIERVLEERYGDSDNEDFLQLVEAISTEKSEGILRASVKKLYNFARNHAFYNEWLDAELMSIAGATNSTLTASIWYVQLIKPRLLEILAYCHTLCDDMEALCVQHGGDMPDLYKKNIENCRTVVTNLTQLVSADDWGGLCNLLDTKGLFDRLATKGKKEIDPEYIDSFKGLRDELKKLVTEDIKGLVYITEEQYRSDLLTVSALTTELFGLVKRVDTAFTKAKRIRRRVDFQDLEQLALSLMYTDRQNLAGVSSVAKTIASGIKEIMVDEYQDTNDAQEKLFLAITDKNLFMVGDVKQSIYRFREAKPENFLEKRQSFTPVTELEGADSVTGLRIDLSENFRTHSAITGFINYTCKELFSESIGEMELQDGDMLVPSGSFSDNCHSGVELLLSVDKECDPAKMVAKRIAELLSSGMQIDYVSADGTVAQRSISPSDICVLMRARTHMQEYADALAELNIPAFSDSRDGFITTLEIYPIVCLIKLIVNPTLDFEMYSVLKSYLYGMSDTELAKIFNTTPKNPLQSLARCEIEGTKRFLEDIDKLKALLLRPSATQCIEYYNSLTNCDADMGELFAELRSMGDSLHGFLEYYQGLESIAKCEYSKSAVTELANVLKNDIDGKGAEVAQLYDFAREKSAGRAVELICGYMGIAVPECIENSAELYDKISLTQLLKNENNVYAEQLAELPTKNENNVYAEQLAELPTYIVSYLACIADHSRTADIYAVLASELYGVDETELKSVLYAGTVSLYTTLAERYRSGERSVLTAFYECLTYLRAESAYKLPSEILRMLYELTGAEKSVMSLGNGRLRLQNLRLFIDYADGYGNDIQSLYNAICKIESMNIGDMRPAKPVEKSAVSIMTIHSSKGLEFPVVVVAELDSNFQVGSKGEGSAIVLNADYGVAFKLRENSGLTQHKTMGYVALELENRRAGLSEELRMLYVATTRAKQLLILSAKDRVNAKGSTKLEGVLKAPYRAAKLSPVRVSRASSMYAWLLDVFYVGTYTKNTTLDKEFSLKLKNGSTVEVKMIDSVAAASLAEDSTTATAENCEYTTEIAESLKYSYMPTEKPRDIKYSVSNLVAQNELESYYFSRKPSILSSFGHSPAERGTAVHRFLQYVDLEKMPSGIEQEISRLVARQFMSKAQAAMLSVDELHRFFTSRLGRRIISAQRVLREPRLMHRYSVDELSEIVGELTVESGGIILQGAADCVIFEDDKLVVIDYKTDRVQNVAELGERYENQLRIYGDILSRSYNTELKELIIYSIYMGEELSIKI